MDRRPPQTHDTGTNFGGNDGKGDQSIERAWQRQRLFFIGRRLVQGLWNQVNRKYH